MKILVLSDLHVEFSPFRPPLESAASADVVVLAGDIHQGNLAPSWARRTFPEKPIVLVAGNHEFYNGHWERTLDSIRESARLHEVDFLEDSAVTIGKVRFLGATFWTDFEYFGTELRHTAMLAAQRCMADYRVVEGCTPQATVERHKVSRAWFERELSAPAAGGRQVVVTHHYPRKESTPEEYRDEQALRRLGPSFPSIFLKVLTCGSMGTPTLRSTTGFPAAACSAIPAATRCAKPNTRTQTSTLTWSSNSTSEHYEVTPTSADFLILHWALA